MSDKTPATIKKGGFTFEKVTGGYSVRKGRRELGEIYSCQEPNGRPGFKLWCDNRKEPRIYRGMKRAAETLLVIDDLQREGERRKWFPEELIVRAWACAEPRAV